MVRARGFGSDVKVNAPDVPENVPWTFAAKRRPRNARGSPAPTASPRPRRRAPPLPRHVIWKLTVAGTPAGAMGVESITATSRTSTSSCLPPRLSTMDSSGIGTVQTSPEGRTPPVKS